jgi:hypothetical protein
MERKTASADAGRRYFENGAWQAWLFDLVYPKQSTTTLAANLRRSKQNLQNESRLMTRS